MALNEQILESKTKEQLEQKSQLKQKIEELEKINAKLQAGETANASRVNQFKSEYDKLHEKYKLIQAELDEKIIETQKMQRQLKKNNQNEVEELKNEITSIKTNV